jgi:SPP1 family predicted phage head-tail adaptor
MPTPGAGKLNRLITLQSRAQGKDSEGGMIDTWTDFAVNIWAKVAHLSGNERRATQHGGQMLEARTEFTIRYLPGVLNTMRVVFNGQHYNIRHVNDFEDGHAFMILTCDTGGNGGR